MSATDDYLQLKDRWQLEAPASHAASVSPSDSADLDHATRALVIGVAGNVKVTTLGGETVTIPLPAGVIPIRVTRVWSTLTTATGIVALW